MNNLLTNTRRFLKKNSSIILTGVGCVGVVATAVLANNAGIKAGRFLATHDRFVTEESIDPLPAKEKFSACWKYYIPAALTGAATITCIVLAEVTNQRKQAGLINAYSLAVVALKDYQKKVEELYGENANSEVREAIGKDHIVEHLPSEDDKMLFFDFNTLQYFESTMEEVVTAEYNLNRQMATTGYANLLDFYRELGIPAGRSIYDEVWAVEPCDWIDFKHEMTTVDNDLECCIISIENKIEE